MTDSDLVEHALIEGRLFSLTDCASTTGLSTDEAAAALAKLVAQGSVRDYDTGLQKLYRLTGSKGKSTRLARRSATPRGGRAWSRSHEALG